MLRATGTHEVYAASEDNAGADETPVSASFKIDRTPPTVTCAAPMPTFQLGSAGGLVTAVVGDAGSGAVSSSVSATASAETAGAHTVDLTGEDVAGNTTTVGLPLRGRRLRVRRFLVAAAEVDRQVGQHAAAQVPVAGRERPADQRRGCAGAASRRPARSRSSWSSPAGPVPGCPSYDPISKQFQLNVKTTAAMKGANGVSVTVTFGTTVVTTGAVEPFIVR